MRDPRSIVRKLQVTEKGTELGDQNKYLVEVATGANKIEIRSAVESLFKVKVTKVNTMNYDGKVKRMRTGQAGRRPAWKRAVVTLAEGNSIDLT
jgi:large subunit ribosomal protein L23